ncbi:MAG: hypothetical protein Q7S33_03400 [Nanoarchaeota archaeon]|nr:hypothetical protein [Nanoarchaeota archaeon]
MITYNDLYEVLRKERYSEQLQPLPKNFFPEVSEYFRDKKEFSDKDEDMFSEISVKNKKKLENAIIIFKEILWRRKKKILNLAFVAFETGISKRDFENLASFEKELFEDIIKSLEKSNKNIENNMKGEKPEQKYRLVRFLEDVSEFLDLNSETIGPFTKGEIVNMDKEIVDILAKDKRVEVLDEE